MNFNIDQFDDSKHNRSKKDSASLPTENSIHFRNNHDNYEFFPPNQFIDKTSHDSIALSKISKNTDSSNKITKNYDNYPPVLRQEFEQELKMNHRRQQSSFQISDNTNQGIDYNYENNFLRKDRQNSNYMNSSLRNQIQPPIYTQQNQYHQQQTYNQQQLPEFPMNYTNHSNKKIRQNNYQNQQVSQNFQAFKLETNIGFDFDYLPQDVLFLLSEEDSNISKYRTRIEEEKEKINKDIQTIKKSMDLLLEDLRLTLVEKLDAHYSQYFQFYKQFKEKVIDFKNIKNQVPIPHMQLPIEQEAKSNQALVNELIDLKYKNQLSKLYSYLSQLQQQNITNVIDSSKGLLALTANIDPFYNEQNTNQALQDIKNKLGETISSHFQNYDKFIKPLDFDLKFLYQEQLVETQNQNSLKTTQTPIQKLQFDASPIKSLNKSKQPIRNQQYANPYSVPIDLTDQNQKQIEDTNLFKSNYNQGYSVPYQLDSPESEQENKQEISLTHKKQLLLENYHPMCLVYLTNNLIAIGCKDRNILIINVLKMEMVAKLQSHQAAVTALSSIQISNHSCLISGSDNGDCTMTVWMISLTQQTLKRIVETHQAAINDILIVNPSLFISASADKTIQIHKMDSEDIVQKLNVHQSSVTRLCSIGKQGFASSGMDLTLNIWNYKLNKINGDIEGCSLNFQINSQTIIYSMISTQQTLYAGGKDGKIRIINLESQDEDCISVHNSPVVQLSIVEDKIISCSCKNKNLISTNMQTLKCDSIQLDEKGNFEFGLVVNSVMSIQRNIYYLLNQGNSVELFDQI